MAVLECSQTSTPVRDHPSGNSKLFTPQASENNSNIRYADFAPMFKAELFDPDHWADVFKKAGAKCEE